MPGPVILSLSEVEGRAMLAPSFSSRLAEESA